jgi:hypothetical protein
MSTTLDEINAPGKLIYQLIVEAQNAATLDRRADVRFAFFRPVQIHLDDGRSFRGFSREISASGIGLAHEVELPLGEIELRISHENGYDIRIRTNVLWCQSCGHGWYISGGRFVAPATIAR